MDSEEEKRRMLKEGEVWADWVEPDPSDVRPVSKETADDIFKETDANLLFLLQRLPLAERLDTEWERYRIRDPEVRVTNDLLNALFWDALRMTVIDLASFCEWMGTDAGFFGKLLAHRNAFHSPRGPSHELQVWEQLFPGGRYGNRADAIRRESEEFRKKTKPLVTDRNSGFKAHRFDGYNLAEHGLKLKQIKTQVAIIKDVLNRYKLVLTDATMLYELRPVADTEGTAEDLMDILVHGSIDGAAQEFEMVPAQATWLDYRRDPHYWARRKTWFDG
jgi:hypothetical protein